MFSLTSAEWQAATLSIKVATCKHSITFITKFCNLNDMQTIIGQVIMRCCHYFYLINEPWLHPKLLMEFSFIFIPKGGSRHQPGVLHILLSQRTVAYSLHIAIILYVDCVTPCKHENPFWCCCEGLGWCNWWNIARWCANVSDKPFLPCLIPIKLQPSTTLLTVHVQQ